MGATIKALETEWIWVCSANLKQIQQRNAWVCVRLPHSEAHATAEVKDKRFINLIDSE